MLKIRQRAAQPLPIPTLPTAALEARLRASVEALAVPRHLLANADGNAWVRDALLSSFSALGWRVHRQGPYDNVIALPARKSAEPLTLVAAHYDAVPDCPGADDNASGLAVLLECARRFGGRGQALGLVAFNAEEDGMLGSQDFVAHGLGSLPAPVRLIHVLEMVGFRQRGGPPQTLPLPGISETLRAPDFLGLLARNGSNPALAQALSSSAAPALRLLGAQTWGPLYRLFPDLARSDHLPFWNAGLPALLWTDTANFRNPHYHRRSDRPETLDYGFMAEVSTLLEAALGREPAR